jgi:poly-gamma-glutamate synthesis protein (capsule biosynthesis protein)
VLSYTFGFNGRPYPGGERWRANAIDVAAIVAAARTARARGAQAVILALHWGAEYQHAPSAAQLDLAPRLARSRLIDVIIGHHAHVVSPVERIGRTWVVYGLGNMIAWHTTPGAANAEGLLVRFTLTRRSATRFRVTRAEYLPLLVARDAPIRLLAVPNSLDSGDYGSSTRARLREALARTTRVVNSRGGPDDGLTKIARPPQEP